MRTRTRPAVLAAMLGGGLLLAGCQGPSKVNIELRKQNQQLAARIDELQRRHDADEATIRGLQSRATTVPVLPEDELDDLFTTAGLQFGRLTGGYHPDPNQPGDAMLKIYVVPIDRQGDEIKAAGTFHVELFDPALGATNRIGEWDFDLQAAKADWYGSGLLYTYVLSCPWQTVPVHDKLQARVTFRDALTHREFTVDREVRVEVPQAGK
ncbi:MAG: hypothetical protein ABSB74_10385 [Tepidisphaeraceae bacterium]